MVEKYPIIAHSPLEAYGDFELSSVFNQMKKKREKEREGEHNPMHLLFLFPLLNLYLVGQKEKQKRNQGDVMRI